MISFTTDFERTAGTPMHALVGVTGGMWQQGMTGFGATGAGIGATGTSFAAAGISSIKRCVDRTRAYSLPATNGSLAQHFGSPPT